MFAALAAMAFTASAGVFSTKTMQAELPPKQSHEEFVLPKGWMQAEIALDHKATHGYRDEDGTKTRYEHGVTWSTTQLWLRFDHGFSRRIRFYLHAPWVEGRLRNDHGTNLATRALGDVHTGAVLQPVIGKRSAVALKIDVKAPSGLEWPANFVGGPTGTGGFLTGTGITNVGAHGMIRYRVGGALALKIDAAYVLKVPGVVGYVVEKDGFANGWFDPGDEALLHGSAVHDLLPGFALLGDAWLSYRGHYRIGVSGPGVFRTDLVRMDRTNGAFLDLGMGVAYRPDRQVELRGWFKSQVLGADTRHFAALGLTEFSPQPGTELGVSTMVRF